MFVFLALYLLSVEESNIPIYSVQRDQLEPCKSKVNTVSISSWLPLCMAMGPRAAVPLHTVGVRAGRDTDVVQVLGGQCRAARCPTELCQCQWGSCLGSTPKGRQWGRDVRAIFPPPPPQQKCLHSRLFLWDTAAVARALGQRGVGALMLQLCPRGLPGLCSPLLETIWSCP